MDLTKQFFKYVSQNIFGLLGTSCYILADTYFIAQTAGTDGVTLLNLCLPIYNFIFAIGSMIALGSATRYAIAKAQNDARGQRYFSNAILCAVLASIPWMLAGAFVPGALLRLMGGDAGIVALGIPYARIFLLFTPFFMCNYIVSAFVRNDGDPSLAMVATLSGSLFNVVFDYIFMFPLGLGLAGAALATAVSPIISIAICSRHFLKKENTLQFVRQLPSARLLGQSCQLGISGFVGELSSGVTTTVFNFLLLGLAGNVGVAAYGVVANFALVATAIFNGVAQGAQPLVSRCYGQNDHAGAGGGAVRCGVRPDRYLCKLVQQRELGADGAVRPHRDADVLCGLLFCGLQHHGGGLSERREPPGGGFHHLHLPGHGGHRGLFAGAQRGVWDAGRMGGIPGFGAAHRAADPVSAAQKRERKSLNIHLLFPHGLLGCKPGLCGATGQCPPLCRGLAGFFFEYPAQVVGPGKAAQAGHYVQRVFPVQQQPLRGFDAHGGQVFARRHAHGGGKGAHKMAFGDAQPLAELLHAVQPRVVGADILNSGLHQRRQGGRGAVGIRQLAQQGKDQLAAGTAVGGLFLGKPPHQLSGGRAGLAFGKIGQLPQAVQKLRAGLPGQLDTQQVAAVLRGQSERGTA